MGPIRTFIQSFFYPVAPISQVFQVQKESDLLDGEYKKSVNLIRKKYFNLDPKGALTVKTIVDFRATVIAGGEISFSAKKSTLKDLEYWLNEEKANEKSTSYAQLLEREGRIAIVLYKKPNGWGFRALPWHQYKYDLIYDEYDNIKGIKYETGKGYHTIEKPFLIYVQYSGQEEYSKESVAPPKIAYCLNDINKIEDEMERWENINHFFADPTPHLDTTDTNFFKTLVTLLRGNRETRPEGSSANVNDPNYVAPIRRWKVGSGLTTVNTKLTYVQADMRGIESLDRMVQVRSQRITSLTGFPIYLLYPELMSNRATAVEIAADANQATVLERRKNEELWAEIAKSWAVLQNIFIGTAYDPNEIYATLPQTSAAQVKLLIETFGPLVDKKQLSKRTFMEMLPLVDYTSEIKRIEEENGSEISSISNAMLNFTGDNNQQ